MSSLAFDVGLLTPVAVGHGGELGDDAIVGALVAAEVALARAWAELGVAPAAAARDISAVLGWQGVGLPCAVPDLAAADLAATLAAASVAGGNPVIPLVGELRGRVPAVAQYWVHRGATSQDILDSALMLTAARSLTLVLADLRVASARLGAFAVEHSTEVCAARTLTQHAVPTTLGARAAAWNAGVLRATQKLAAAAHQLPAQLGGAGGTLAAFVEIGGAEIAAALPSTFAQQLGLAAPAAPWHTVRWPVTELGDALTQVIGALGVIAADVATLSRTEIAELAEGEGGGSSAMPQKQNPARSVLIRSAALRAPFLSATLHAAAAAAVDERPDGAWHAEWPTLRELLRLARGAAANAVALVTGLRVNHEAIARNLALTGDGIVAERESIVRAAGAAGAAGSASDAVPERGPNLGKLDDPAQYTGLAAAIATQIITSTTTSTPTQEQL